MMPSLPSAFAHETHITLIAILAKLRRQRWIIAGSVLAVLLFSLVFLAHAKPEYSVSMKLTVSEDDTSRANLAQQGLMSLAMLAGGGMQNQDLNRYTERLNSLPVALYLQEKHQLLQQVYARYWNKEKQQWQAPRVKKYSPKALLRKLSGLPLWTPPSEYDLSRYITANVRPQYDTKSGTLKLEVRHTDPEFGRNLLEWVHEAVTYVTRQQGVERINQRIRFLRERVENESLLEYRAILFQMIANEEKKRLLTAHELPFYIEVFAPPSASSAPVSPRPVLVLGIALITGIVLGMVLALLNDALQQAKREEEEQRQPTVAA